MKISACVFPVIEKLDLALAEMHKYIDLAIEQKSDLIIFPEASLGGLNISGNCSEDIQKCFTLNSSEINSLRQKAKLNSLGIGFGFLENYQDRIYDSFVLFDKNGDLAIHYHRISRGWLLAKIISDYYGCGTIPEVAKTIYGKIGILICGDLFETEIINQLIIKEPDFYIHILARSFPFTQNIQEVWNTEEFPFYLLEYQKLGKTVIVINCVEEKPSEQCAYCGGAWLIKENRITKEMPLLQPGLLTLYL